MKRLFSRLDICEVGILHQYFFFHIGLILIPTHLLQFVYLSATLITCLFYFTYMIQ